jgi:hypothetical protein
MNRAHNYLFRCDKCQFVTDNKKDYRRHTESAKHARRTGLFAQSNVNAVISPFSEPNTQPSEGQTIPQQSNYLPTPHQPDQLAFIFEKHIYKYCDKCGSKYHSKSGLWKHRKTCDGIPVQKQSQPSSAGAGATAATAATAATGTTNDQEFKSMMLDMLKNNQEFQQKLIEMMCSQQSLVINAVAAVTAAASSAATTASSAATSAATAATTAANSNHYNGTLNSHNNNSNNNNNNNTFNLQFFLNEQCKDAMNINEFANTINLKESDLDEFGRMGYVEGMSKLFIDSLKQTNVFKRPIHCSDARRETLYIKHADKWEREGPENTKITNAVRVVEHKNIMLVNEWAKQNPRCEDSTTKENAQYINMSRAVLDGDDRNIAKVIKKVVKEVVIEKPNRGN